ncbi:MAG: fatty acid desaturase [Planctomycetota bacterium]
MNLTAILLPFVVFIGAVVYAWGWGVGWLELSLLLGMYIVTGLGVTVGFHRYFTHKSFECGPTMRTILGIAGSMAVEGSILRWAAFHRAHHQHSDHELDPHSPHGHGHGIRGVLLGAWRAHVGWMLDTSDKGLERYVVDLREDKLVKSLSDLFPLWMVISFVIPAVIGGLVSMSWTGALLGLVWGGFVRVLLVHHITWSVNSVCHLWGTRAYKSHDESRNNAIVGVLAFGEGWHNNHHAFPTSARHGLKWWQFDSSWILIRTLQLLGLAWKVRVPTPERLEAKKAA